MSHHAAHVGLRHLLITSSLVAGMLLPVVAVAGPVGGNVSAGAASIVEGANRVDIHQSTDKAVIDWRGFDVGAGEITQFHQPSSTSFTLNRVNDVKPSAIDGSLIANGNVMVVNPNGVVFGAGAKVDVGGIVASSAGISNQNFMDGNLRFDVPGNAGAKVSNAGTITAKQGGLVGLVAPQVENSGVITATLGKAQLASGEGFTLDMAGDGITAIAVSNDLGQQLLTNSGRINANGGTVALTAAAASTAVKSLITNTGTVEATTLQNKNGRIILSAEGDKSEDAQHSVINEGTLKAHTIDVVGKFISHTGTMDASGTSGGTINLSGKNIAQQGTIKADGTSGKGGNITASFTGTYMDNESSTTSAKSGNAKGGTIALKGQGDKDNIFSSGKYDATGKEGGTITEEATNIKLYAAQLNASGKNKGGEIKVGGDYQGGGTLKHAKETIINPTAKLNADATDSGKGGTVVVWSDEHTRFAGTATAKGGKNGGDGGLIEVSSKDTLAIDGKTDASALWGKPGRVLLDPKNIIIQTGGITKADVSGFELIDPNPGGTGFASNPGSDAGIYALSTGNVLLSAPRDDFAGANAGAAYLFNGITGALISALYGNANDMIGNYGVSNGGTVLPNGNFVLRSIDWNMSAGAVTFINGTTGLSGIVSAANSLVGNPGDQVGFDTADNNTKIIGNSNYLVTSPNWNNARGAVTWGDGTTGITGVVSAANSFIGQTDGDRVGKSTLILSNGNYVVKTNDWDNGLITNVGAVTWGNGNSALIGSPDVTNSLIGSTANDQVGHWGELYQTNNGNYLIQSPNWDNGGILNAGAITIGSGISGVTGVVSAANSLVGSTASDQVGNGSFYFLSNGDVITTTTTWDGVFANVGAVTHLRGDGSTVGTISAANSLVGSTLNDQVGSGGVTLLSNGHYVVRSPNWDNGTADVGAVTWANGNGSTVGAVNAANSLIGSTLNDRVGSSTVVALTNGNYVVGSPLWNNGAVADAGAVTWGNGLGGTVGVVSVANSLVGSTLNDQIGYASFTPAIYSLGNGNYVVGSGQWNNGAVVDAGAVTWGNGLGGTVGTISVANSLVGSTLNDRVGFGSSGIQVLSNGNYLALTPLWNNGVVADAGAITWGNGLGGTAGVISAANSLVGSAASDGVGTTVTTLANGNAVASTTLWNNGAVADAGAVTWLSGTAPTAGVINVANSLIGSTANDRVGIGGVLKLSNGHYVVSSYLWDNGLATDAGAVTWGNGNGGTVGVVSAANSIVGSTTNDQIGRNGGHTSLIELSNGNYAVLSNQFDNGADANTGAVTLGLGTGGTIGAVSAANSFIGPTNGGAVGTLWGVQDTVHGRLFVGFATQERLFSISNSYTPAINGYTFNYLPSSTLTIDPTFITATLNTGTAVTLQASNDITVNSNVIANNPGGDGGAFTLQAGRSILVNANITSDNGNVNLYANEVFGAGVIDAQRDAGNAVITMAPGTTINAGTGNIDLQIKNGFGRTNIATGDLTLDTLTGNNILAYNSGSGNVIVNNTITSAAAGNSLVLASESGNFINNAGAASLNPGAGYFLVYSNMPALDTRGGLTGQELFGYSYSTNPPSSIAATANKFLYRSAPGGLGGTTPSAPATTPPVTVPPVAENDEEDTTTPPVTPPVLPPVAEVPQTPVAPTIPEIITVVPTVEAVFINAFFNNSFSAASGGKTNLIVPQDAAFYASVLTTPYQFTPFLVDKQVVNISKVDGAEERGEN